MRFNLEAVNLLLLATVVLCLQPVFGYVVEQTGFESDSEVSSSDTFVSLSQYSEDSLSSGDASSSSEWTPESQDAWNLQCYSLSESERMISDSEEGESQYCSDYKRQRLSETKPPTTRSTYDAFARDRRAFPIEQPPFEESKRPLVGSLLANNKDVFSKVAEHLDSDALGNLKLTAKAYYQSYLANDAMLKTKLQKLWDQSPILLWSKNMEELAQWRAQKPPKSQVLSRINRLVLSQSSHNRGVVKYSAIYECYSNAVKGVQPLQITPSALEPPKLPADLDDSSNAALNDSYRARAMALERHRRHRGNDGIVVTFRLSMQKERGSGAHDEGNQQLWPFHEGGPYADSDSAPSKAAFKRPRTVSPIDAELDYFQHCSVRSYVTLFKYNVDLASKFTVELDNEGQLHFDLTGKRLLLGRKTMARVDPEMLDATGRLPVALMITQSSVKVFAGKNMFPFPQYEQTVTPNRLSSVYVDGKSLYVRASNSSVPGIYSHTSLSSHLPNRWGQTHNQNLMLLENAEGQDAALKVHNSSLLTIGNALSQHVTVEARVKGSVYGDRCRNLLVMQNSFVRKMEQFHKSGDASFFQRLPYAFHRPPTFIDALAAHDPKVRNEVGKRILKPLVRDVLVYAMYTDDPRETLMLNSLLYPGEPHRLTVSPSDYQRASFRLKLFSFIDAENTLSCLTDRRAR